MKILLAAGGTAGHIHPALATAVELQRRHPEWELAFIGTATGLESRIVPEHGYLLECIPRTPMPRTFTRDLLAFPFTLWSTIRAAQRTLIGADCLVGFGGYVSAPSYLAARRLGIPIVVHEQNAKPGFANRLGARLTRHVATSFASTRLPHATVTGLPLNSRILAAASNSDRGSALARFGLSKERPVLLITGGSQGSQRLNHAVAEVLTELIADGWQVLHAVGEKNPLPPSATNYLPRPFISDMDTALLAADLLVGRSGASTCAEALAMRLPAIYVPLPIGNGEQAFNAVDQVGVGGAVITPDSTFTGSRLLELVRQMRPRLADMRDSLRRLPGANGTAALVDLIEGAL